MACIRSLSTAPELEEVAGEALLLGLRSSVVLASRKRSLLLLDCMSLRLFAVADGELALG